MKTYCYLFTVVLFLSLGAFVTRGEDPKMPPDSTAREAVVAAFNQARDLAKQGKHAEAAAAYEKLLPTATQAYGKDSLSVATILNNLGLAYQQTRQYAKALPLLERSYALREAKLGGAHPDVLQSIRNISNLRIAMVDDPGRQGNVGNKIGTAPTKPPITAPDKVVTAPPRVDSQDEVDPAVRLAVERPRELAKQGRLAEAAVSFELGLQAAVANFGAESKVVADILMDGTELYRKMKQYPKAELSGKRSLAIYEAKFGQDQHTAQALSNLAQLYSAMSQHAKAEPLLLRTLAIYEAKLGKDDVATGNALYNLAMLYINLRQLAKAEPLLRRSLAIHDAKLGENHFASATIFNELVRLHADMGDFGKSVPLLRRSLETYEARFGKDSPKIVSTLTNLALLHYSLDEYARAEPLLQRGLAIREAKLGKDDSLTAESLKELGKLYHAMGQYSKAQPLLERSLSIYEAKFGKDHPETAMALSSLAGLSIDMGERARAEQLYCRSLAIYEAKLGSNHPDSALTFVRRAADILERLGEVYFTRGDYAKAEQHYLRSLAMCDAKLGKDHHHTASALERLAGLYVAQGEHAKAEQHYLRSLAIHETKLGRDHPKTAIVLNNLAFFCQELGQHARAEAFHRRSLAIHEAKLGKDHPHTALALMSAAHNFAAQQKWTPAVEIVHKANRGTAHHVASVLPSWSEQAQLTFLKDRFTSLLHLSLSLGYAAPEEAGTASAEWLLNSKALSHQSLAEQHLIARDAKDPMAKQLVKDLQTTRAQLAVLINRQPDPGMEKDYQQQMHDLRVREQDLAQQLARAVGRPYRANPWVTLDELRAKLGAKTAYVDIARFEVYDFKARKTIGSRYVAWITPPQGRGEVQLIELGAASVIDKLVAQTRKALLDSAKSIKQVGEIKAAQALQESLEELSAKVLHPLLPTLAKYEEWIIAPDGALWLTPWSALLLQDGKHAIEKHRIRHVISGRDLVSAPGKTGAKAAIIVGDPDYDLSPTQALTAAGALRANSLPTLLGQRLRGTIGSWHVSFDFHAKGVTLRDEDDGGKAIGEGSWQRKGLELTIKTKHATFVGTLATDTFHGERTMPQDDGTVKRDRFRIDWPREEGTRFLGAVHAVLPQVERLPGTALEAEAIAPRLEQWLGQKPAVFLEGRASETVLKALKTPRVLTLATHGYFLPSQKVAAKDGPGLTPGEGRTVPLLDTQGKRLENPLLRCGLLFAGCNKSAEAKAGEDDGILTGLEIVGLNLQGCELVVLSACETALGEVRNGEGVAGLRQAFQLAGARGVLASLWIVHDGETALLMNSFYGELANGKSQTEALRQAQLQRIASRRQQFGAAHPFFWAAFTLTNRGTE